MFDLAPSALLSDEEFEAWYLSLADQPLEEPEPLARIS